MTNVLSVHLQVYNWLHILQAVLCVSHADSRVPCEVHVGLSYGKSVVPQMVLYLPHMRCSVLNV